MNAGCKRLSPFSLLLIAALTALACEESTSGTPDASTDGGSATGTDGSGTDGTKPADATPDMTVTQPDVGTPDRPDSALADARSDASDARDGSGAGGMMGTGGSNA